MTAPVWAAGSDLTLKDRIGETLVAQDKLQGNRLGIVTEGRKEKQKDLRLEVTAATARQKAEKVASAQRVRDESAVLKKKKVAASQ